MAIPAINTALIPSAQKDAFNQGSPSTDAAQFRATAATTITGLRTAVDAVLGGQTGGPLGSLSADQVAAALIPDIVTINFANPVQFPNGRRLQDDVIDAALGRFADGPLRYQGETSGGAFEAPAHGLAAAGIARR